MVSKRQTSLNPMVIILIVIAIIIGGLFGLVVGLFMIKPIANPASQELTNPDANDIIASVTIPAGSSNDNGMENVPPAAEPTNTTIPTVILTQTTTEGPICQRPERVLLIVMDGMRPDAIWNTDRAPYLLHLAQDLGAYTWQAKTIKPSKTIPAHTSLFTGYDVPTHGVADNQPYKDQALQDGIVLDLPTIFTRLKDKNENAIMLFVAGNKALNYFTQPVLDEDIVHNRADNFTVAEDAKRLIIEYGFDLMFINFSYTDIIGHKFEWMSDQYLDAVKQADDAIGYILDTLNQLSLSERTLVIILADHGGKGSTHSLNRLEDETIPLIIIGSCIKQGYELQNEPRRIHITDIAPTILYALGMEITPDIEGQVIRDAFKEEFKEVNE